MANGRVGATKPSCESCFFHQNLLCAVTGVRPCATYRPNHPEGWYFRSDHVPYAERNVPSLFFSSNLHNDYHTPRDEPQNINYHKLTRMAQWMYMTGWLAANARERPAIDAGFVLR